MTSGKGLFQLNKLHRTRENSLTDVARIADEPIPKYRQVNYEAMREMIDERKRIGSQALQRVSQLQNHSHALREQAELKILRQCWLNEQHKLNQQYRKCDHEHRTWLTDAFHDADLLNLCHEITRYRIWLDENTIQFRQTTVLPMMQLKEGLQACSAQEDNSANVIDALQSVKNDQQALMNVLHQEGQQLEEELNEFQRYLDDDDDGRIDEEGIPDSTAQLPCPDEELRATMLQEFLIIDHKYRESLVDLDVNYLPIVQLTHGGWDADEHEMLVHLYDTYPVDLKKRRTCIYDHFHRHYPSRSRQEMLKHEEWCNARNYYLKHKRLILFEWKQARAALEVKVRSSFEQAFELLEHLAQQEEDKMRQRALCEQLANQVEKWREKQLEVLEIKRKLEESKRQAELEKAKQENDRFLRHRQEAKDKLSEYNVRKEHLRVEEDAKEQQRLDEMQSTLAEQQRKDWERIKFRQEEYERKRQELQERTQTEELETQQREERLQALADRVRPHHIDMDHARLLQPTKAFNAHRGLLADLNEDINIQQPLFPIHTFTDRKLQGDIRVRLEQRLRDAGLMQTDYARQALAAVQQAPKRIDTRENKMWSGFTFQSADLPTRDASRPIKRDFISHPVFYGADG